MALKAPEAPSIEPQQHPDTTSHRLRARLGAYSLHSQRDGRETTAAGRAAFLNGFEKQVDPDNILPPAERARRAAYARKAYFARLSYLSAKARSARAQRRNGGRQ